MAIITEQERIKELENIKEILGELEIAAEVLPANGQVPQTCLVVSLPTNVKEWEEEFKEDLHMASVYLLQMGEDPNQLTKYLMLYAPVQVDLGITDELKIYKLINEANHASRIGTYFYGESAADGRMMVQVKWMIGGYVEEYLDEGVVCEAIYELGYAYDEMKQQLFGLIKEAE